MSHRQLHISVKGKQVSVPSIRIGTFEIITTGKWLKKCSVWSEDYIAEDPASDATRLVSNITAAGCHADFFTFAQRMPDISPKYNYPMLWENVAAVPTESYSAWWDALSQDTRRNVRLAQKRGLVIRSAVFDDEFVRGIMTIYNETPQRQGRKFWHYGKDFETVKAENGTCLERSQFIGAYHGEELVGFLKFVAVGPLASIMQILSKNAHQDKKPMNALVAKAIEIACEKRLTHLLYRRYVYHRPDALTEFKRRNGFEKVQIPRYFVPLTAKGKLAVKLNLHRGVKEMMPDRLKKVLLDLRRMYADIVARKQVPNVARS